MGRDGFETVLDGMIGNLNREMFLGILNAKLKSAIVDNKNEHGCIHLLYSKNELTYERQIIHLINELKNNMYTFDEKVECFTDHNDVGKYFLPWFKNWLSENT